MKKIIKYIIGSIIIIAVAFAIYMFTNKYNLHLNNSNIDWSIDVKGYDGAKSFDYDESGNLYIAFKDTIRIVDSNGKDEVIIRDSSFNIYDILCNNDKLFIATDNKIVEYDMKSFESTDLITGIPNNGINKEIRLLIKDNTLYFTIGSNTNAGVVSKEGEEDDKPVVPVTLTGVNYGDLKTGAFSQFGVSTQKGEKKDAEKLGNGAIMAYSFESKKSSIYSYGLRNINGWDIDSDGKLKGIVGGIEDNGVRSIKDDKDYIYDFKKSAWYGWPDYSGGDPITSPKFTDGKKVEFLIENHPSNTILAPIYQHVDVNSLKGFAIDKIGKLFDKNTMIFADNKVGKLYSLTDKGILNELVDFKSKSNIEKIEFYNGSFYVLDSKLGCLYNLQVKDQNNIFKLPIQLWLFVCLLVVVFIFGLVVNLKKNIVEKRSFKLSSK